MSLAELRTLRDPSPADPDPDEIVLSAMDRRLTPRLITPLRALAAVAIVAFTAVSVFAYQRYGLVRTLSLDPQHLKVSTVTNSTFHEYIPLTGNVVPRTTVYLDAVDGGQITDVYVEEGALVEAGQPLVALKNTNLQLQVIAAEAQLTEQLNQLNQTSLTAEQTRLDNRRSLIDVGYQIEQVNRELARARALIDTGGTPQSTVDDLEAELVYRQDLRNELLDAQRVDDEFRETQTKRMRDALDAMNRNLSIARENLDNLVVTAPIAGQLTLLDANVGESKAPGQRIGQIDEQHAFKVSAFVDEFYLTRVALGQPATFDIGGQSQALEVVKVYPDVRNRQFQVDLGFAGSAPGALRRGQTVRMRLEIGEPADTLVLENGAFYDDTGGQWVFLLDTDGNRAERRSVHLGRRNPEGIEVLEGLKAGDRVITSSYENLTTFDRIQFRDGS